jgi:hypothetical protein
MVSKQRSIPLKKLLVREDRHAVWKALDLVSSSPFSKQIERAELPERYTAPRYKYTMAEQTQWPI